jgi:hypothetical protein
VIFGNILGRVMVVFSKISLPVSVGDGMFLDADRGSILKTD